MRVKNIHKRQPYDVYIGRGSIWGNPYPLSECGGDRALCLFLYLGHLQRTKLYKQVDSLKGKTLGCYCAPNPCHGDLLAELSDAAELKRTLNRMLHSAFQHHIRQRLLPPVSESPPKDLLFDFLTPASPSVSYPSFELSFSFFQVALEDPCTKTLDKVSALWYNPNWICWSLTDGERKSKTRMFFCIPINNLRKKYG